MTAGERFVNADEFKAFAGQTRPRGRVIVEVKDISSLTTDAAGSVGTLVHPGDSGLGAASAAAADDDPAAARPGQYQLEPDRI
jgi:hypothetical protein